MREADGSISGVMALAHEITEQVLSRKKVEASETKFRSLIEEAPVATCLFTGKEMRVEVANDKILAYWGKGKDIIGKTLAEGVPELTGQHFFKILDDVFTTGKVHEGKNEVAQLKVNGVLSTYYFNYTYKPIRNAAGEVYGIMNMAVDVTEQVIARKKIEESEKRYNMMLMQSPFAFAVLKGKDMVITLANDSVKEMWGKGKEIEGKPLLQVLPEIKDQRFPALLNKVYTTGIAYTSYESLARLQRKGIMEDVYFNFAYQPYHEADETISGVVIIATEVTPQAMLNQKIKESETQFRQVAELMPQKIWTSDAEGNKDYFNKTLLDYAGYSFEELKGNGWQQIIHPEDWELNKMQWEEAISTGQDYETENRLLRKDGEYLWHLTRAVALKDEAGKIKMWVGSKTEIQEQKEQKKQLEISVEKRTQELRAANKELQNKNDELFIAKEKLLTEYSRSLIEASLDPLITIDIEGNITDVNDAMIKATGKAREKLIGTKFISYFIEKEKAEDLFKNVFAHGHVINCPLTIIDGVLSNILINASIYKNEKNMVQGAVVVARDITQIKRIENELREAKKLAELATVIAEAAKDNAEKAASIAEEAVKSKQQFLSNMSHEIRTPMNAIIGFSKVVLKTDLTAKQKEYLNAIKISGDALIVLINDILDLAKVDSGKITFEQIPFNLSASVTAMIHLFEPKVEEKNIRLFKEYDNKIPQVLLGDPVRLHQIILNLVGNAVKFTNKGKITVSVSLLNEDEEKVTVAFAISDTGIGIPQDKIATIFENFQQASADTSRLYGGTGLGLAISKQLIEMQGGSLTVKSKAGQGAVFSFTLSFKKTTARVEAAAEIIKIAAQIKSINVLVVEDVALNQLLIKTLLEDFGFDCDICANGKIAIEKLQANTYDIVLMDLQMPEMNGFEATEYIRHTMHLAIPIIALTADVTTADVTKCKAVGMNDYISKPVDEKLLYSKIIKLMELPGAPLQEESAIKDENIKTELKYTNLEYLQKHTKSNPKLMMEMIQLYLEQTPPLINTIKQSLADKNWEMLQAAVHKMIPSFSIVGMHPDFTAMAKKIMEYSIAPHVNDEVHSLVLQLEKACGQACIEMEEAYNSIKNTSS